ncbi:MAG: aminotransferase class I/II-fold pyridoxal phosphate-dependent enzyme [Caldilineae bacterium]|nr:MAG: aminotransferase class I/II-fold pyridoxal phosphate-dependent enzyme [Caldilineae bacterium]
MHTFAPAQRVQSFGTTVFAAFTALAIEHQAVNLGQGFPDFPAPDFVVEAARTALAAGHNQYARSAGHPRLVKALSAVYSPLFGRELDPLREIVVTTGATEAIFAAIQALVDPGDEVILIEPFYDSYPASVIMAGGRPVYVPLRAPSGASSAQDWRLDIDELRGAVTSRTRLLVLNTPHNPVGKVFTREELEEIADVAQEHDLLVLSDEVYEWMTYDDVPHVRIATLPGMWERTVTVGSAGKTFSVTGWKIGWTIAPPNLSHAVLMAHQWIPFAVTTPLQEAVGAAFEQAEELGYFTELRTMYQAKRDKLAQALAAAGLTPVTPQGSYFILVDTAHLDAPTPTEEPRDVQICRWLTREIGVAAIPPSAFYSPEHKHLARDVARFCFCKTDQVLDAAAERLRGRLRVED